jgi:hypothetical protein
MMWRHSFPVDGLPTRPPQPPPSTPHSSRPWPRRLSDVPVRRRNRLPTAAGAHYIRSPQLPTSAGRGPLASMTRQFAASRRTWNRSPPTPHLSRPRPPRLPDAPVRRLPLHLKLLVWMAVVQAPTFLMAAAPTSLFNPAASQGTPSLPPPVAHRPLPNLHADLPFPICTPAISYR